MKPRVTVPSLRWRERRIQMYLKIRHLRMIGLIVVFILVFGPFPGRRRSKFIVNGPVPLLWVLIVFLTPPGTLSLIKAVFPTILFMAWWRSRRRQMAPWVFPSRVRQTLLTTPVNFLTSRRTRVKPRVVPRRVRVGLLRKNRPGTVKVVLVFPFLVFIKLLLLVRPLKSLWPIRLNGSFKMVRLMVVKLRGNCFLRRLRSRGR